MPSLSRIGRLTLAGGIGLTLGGLLGAIEPMIGAGQGVLVGVALAWAAAVPLPRRMRRERLEFTWWIASGGSAIRKPDEAVPIRIGLRNPTRSALVLSTPRLAMSPGLRHTRHRHRRLVLPAHSTATVELEVRASYAGRHVLHGAWMTVSGPFGMAWAPLYFPNPLIVQIQPRAGASMAVAHARRQPDVAARAGRATRRLGEGPELRELRDHHPGDPFRRIAWKASARRGKLVVRETEDEAQTTRMIVVDASATMRGDDRGHAKIDYAIELVAQAAKISLSGGDRLGLIGFDARVISHLAPGGGAAHARALTSAATDLRTVLDEDLTDIDDETLVQTVARYFREQEGIDVLRVGSYPESRRRLAEMASRSLREDPSARQPVGAKDPISRIFRAFCRARSIPLPLKHDPTGQAKSNGLAAALRLAVDGARERRTVLVISDLDPLQDLGTLKPALGFAKQRKHRVTFVAPAGESFLAPSAPSRADRSDPVSSAVRELFVGDEAARLRELRTALAAVGIPLYTASTRDAAAHWLRRAAAPHVR